MKVVLLGDSNVGKTSIVTRLTKDCFYETNESTIGSAFSTIRIPVPEENMMVIDIWDTSGQERYRALAPMYYRNADAIIIVVELENIETLKSIAYWLKELRHSGSTISNDRIFIVINKCDLSQNPPSVLNDRECYHTSAKTGQGITELFDCVGKKLLEYRNLSIKVKVVDLTRPHGHLSHDGRTMCCY